MSAPSRRTGRNSAHRPRSSITASSWRAIRTSYPKARLGPRKIVYHDPCYLGRYRDVYDEPREVLARSGKVDRSAALARAQLLLRRRRRTRLPRRRNRRARQSRARQRTRRHRRASIVGTACPFCNTMFRDALAAIERSRRRNFSISRNSPPSPLPMQQPQPQTEHRTNEDHRRHQTGPERDSHLRIDARGQWIDEADLSYEINEPDAYALEEALQLKEKHGGEVIVVLRRPGARSQPPFARPSPRAPIAPSTSNATTSHRSTRSASPSCLAAAIKHEKPDLILTGLQSDDLGLARPASSSPNFSASRTPPSSCTSRNRQRPSR